MKSVSRPSVRIAVLSALALGITGCQGTAPTIGDTSAKTAATGSAGGANSQGENKQLEKCGETLGTVAVVEDTGSIWYQELQSYNLRSTIPVLRLLIQQSNCFVVIERGAAMRNMNMERQLRDSGEMRANSNMGKGQMVAADYTMNPSITFSQKGTGGLGGALGGFGGGVFGAIAGSLKFNDASTVLTMIDNRSGVQLAAAEGSARNTDFNLFGGLVGGSAGGALGGYTNTPEGKVLVAAFIDSYNQLVKSVRSYKAQEVKGGLGTGGRLGVQGGMTGDGAATPAPTPKKSKKKATAQ